MTKLFLISLSIFLSSSFPLNAKETMMSCQENLRASLIKRLEARIGGPEAEKTGRTLSELRERYETQKIRGRDYGLAIEAFHLPDPSEAIPLLKEMLKSENSLQAIEAAATLALLGDKSGVPVLQTVHTCTSSGIEFYYAEAALDLLGEPIPAALAKRRGKLKEESSEPCRKN